MPKTPVDPNDLGALLSDYERRLHNLETASGLTNASMSDPNGIVRLRLGRLTDTGDYGIEVRNSGGVTVYLANGDGVAYPRQPLVLTKVSDFIVVHGDMVDDDPVCHCRCGANPTRCWR
jgi:hypothetical protein